MKILSIDVGIKNLAMCLIDDKKTILEWEVGGVPTKAQDGPWRHMAQYLNEREWAITSDIVLIERQPEKNRSMKAVQYFLHGFLIAKGADIILWDPKHKVPDVVGTGKKMYNKRKKEAIVRCEAFLKDTDQFDTWKEKWDQHDKRDDLADTVMQALSWFNRPPEKQKISKNTTVRPRKPTLCQESSTYSKSNLAWILKNKPEKMSQKRFKKDLNKYFRSISELERRINIW